MLKILNFNNKKKYLFKVQCGYIPGGIDIDFIIIKANNLQDATSTMKSILRHKRKTATTKDSYQIINVTCIDDIKKNVSVVDSVFYQY